MLTTRWALAVKPLGFLRGLSSDGIASAAWAIALARRRGSHGILVIVVLGWVSHGRFEESLVVSPSLDELFIQLREVVYHVSVIH